MRRLALALMLLASLPAFGADLAPLAAKLAGIRAQPKAQRGERGGSALLTEAKHLLRDWVEREMVGLDRADAASGLGDALNKQLRAAGLECESAEDPAGKRCQGGDSAPGFDDTGYVGDVKFIWSLPAGYLALITGAGIECGEDDSVYLYQRRDGAWHRVFEHERDTYTEEAYKPQNIEDVLVSQPAEDGKPPLVLTTGISPWCSSNWQAVYYRLWRIAPDSQSPKPSLDGEGGVFLTDTPVQARLSADDALIEYMDRSIDPGETFDRVVVRHFRIGAGDHAGRVAPFALTPRSLIDEWLVRPWAESAAWTDPKARGRLASWHRKLHSSYVSGTYDAEGGRCRNDPTRWSIRFTFEDPPKPVPPLYFTVRWIAPTDLTLLDIAPKPPAGCHAEAVPVDDHAMAFPSVPGQ